MAQRHHGDQRPVLDLHPVEHLQPLPQPPQDRHRVLHRRLVDQHRLEPPLQRRVLLDMPAVLVDRRRADHVQLTAGQHRLEHVARVHRPLGRPRTHHRVQLVDEQQDPALRRFHLGEHRLQPLLELAAVLRARHQRAHVLPMSRLNTVWRASPPARRPRPLRVRDHRRLATLHRRDHRVRRTQIDADRLRHCSLLHLIPARPPPRQPAPSRVTRPPGTISAARARHPLDGRPTAHPSDPLGHAPQDRR